MIGIGGCIAEPKPQALLLWSSSKKAAEVFELVISKCFDVFSFWQRIEGMHFAKQMQ